MGEALESFKKEQPEAHEQLQNLAKTWSFFKYLMIQVETNLLNADVAIMDVFAELIEDKETKEELMALILKDYQKCLDNIQNIMGEPTATRRVTATENKKLRSPSLKVLHEIQLEYLKKWRQLKDVNSRESEDYLLHLLLLVNALSGGLKSTG